VRNAPVRSVRASLDTVTRTYDNALTRQGWLEAQVDDEADAMCSTPGCEHPPYGANDLGQPICKHCSDLAFSRQETQP
jgi:hypothetical protein